MTKPPIWAPLGFALFLATQISDGLLTYHGIACLGLSAEANPILSWYMQMFGPVPAIVGAKSLAACCGVTLYLLSKHRTMGLLTAFMIVVAVLPWLAMLWPTATMSSYICLPR
jgi:hypothetical protein